MIDDRIRYKFKIVDDKPAMIVYAMADHNKKLTRVLRAEENFSIQGLVDEMVVLDDGLWLMDDYREK